MAAASSVEAVNPDQPKFDALAASFGSLSAALTVWAIVIGLLAIIVALVVAVGGYQWAKVITREAKLDAKEEANRLIQDFLRTDAPRIIREGDASLQNPPSDINSTGSDVNDRIGEAAG